MLGVEMQVVNNIAEMIQTRRQWRTQGLTSALIPTMGYFHEGHLALMKAARTRADRIVVSLFVNPAQFGPSEDLSRYPRDLDRDMRLAASVGVDCLFSPRSEDIYPPDYQTWISVGELAEGLCGAARPGHFRGVATVVAKLFNIVGPDVAIFGEKDFQQLQIVRRMVRDLNLPVEILAHPTVRESDGLAMSSRNSYLDEKERRAAGALFQALQKAKKMSDRGVTSAAEITEAVKTRILQESGTKIDYIFLGDPRTLRPLDILEADTLLALAVWVGKTRLIDNTVLKPLNKSIANIP
jgi:pantoate--beta-alanine ligase